ncbi:MAG: AAA family ATPase [Legionella sp.]|nr:MAG: AAA family ATPase [Legionella sp.]
MPRRALQYITNWLNSNDRKPMVIRGARQVGKTWLVREFAKRHDKQLIELNFEKNPQYQTFFESNDPKTTLLLLGASLNKVIDIQTAILFLDEIQAAPILLSKLRWFAEEMPELPVVAAGSLLEFVLDEHEFSMPVGRITYLHLNPLTFEEFLDAYGQTQLLHYLHQFSWEQLIPLALHEQLMRLFKEYLVIGGMPAAVYSWVNEKSLQNVNRIHHDLLASYRDDFSKYAGKLSLARLEEMLMAIPKMLGEKMVFSRVNKDVPSAVLKSALNLLCQARIARKTFNTAGNGVPLAAEINEKFFKIIFLDVGLVSALLHIRLDNLFQIADINFINSGGLSEQVVGQLLSSIEPYYMSPALYYWVREKKNSSAEIDYLLQQGTTILPIEIKSGSTGSLKSLHLFMDLKKLPHALRINADVPSQVLVQTKTHQEPIQYRLYSLPFYLTEQIHRLLGDVTNP